PLLPAHYITQVAQALASQTQAGIATLAANMADSDEIFNPNAVKVVVDKQGYALYFSRAPIPWHRATFSTTKEMPRDLPYLRHIGLYAYTVGFLKRYSAWSPSPLESIEALEQLRVLWHGEKILVQTVEKAPIAGVDTLEDLQRVESLMKQHSHLN
ncbi:MAG TPA: 3-deoxy-manno-octulosonate cytidylyltransferase, partial [Methylococcaceae bacterium]|nr:3-deoxy-manno-octulosonate cytidylyltransferase [Methylococcaceae bacterium]